MISSRFPTHTVQVDFMRCKAKAHKQCASQFCKREKTRKQNERCFIDQTVDRAQQGEQGVKTIQTVWQGR